MKQDFTNDTLLARWLSGELGEKEKQELESHPDYPIFKKIVDKTETLAPPPYDSQAALAQLKARRTAQNKEATIVKMNPGRQYWKWGTALAAAFVALAVFWFLRPASKQVFDALPGQTVAAALADGSTATLNADSKLSFEEKDESRVASLNGEAYFKVRKSSSPFIVNTSLGQVEVLGTSFNVYSRDSIFLVSCNSGKVSVRIKNQNSQYILTAGKSVEWRSNKEQLQQFDNTQENLDWIGGKSVFTKRPVAEVLAEMERQFDVQFKLATSVDTRQLISITFPNNNIDKALEVLFATVGNLQYEIEGKQVNVRLSDK